MGNDHDYGKVKFRGESDRFDVTARIEALQVEQLADVLQN